MIGRLVVGPEPTTKNHSTKYPPSVERGFDKLMTPMGVNAVVFAMFLFFVVCAAGGVWWRLTERAKRRRSPEDR